MSRCDWTVKLTLQGDTVAAEGVGRCRRCNLSPSRPPSVAFVLREPAARKGEGEGDPHRLGLRRAANITLREAFWKDAGPSKSASRRTRGRTHFCKTVSVLTATLTFEFEVVSDTHLYTFVLCRIHCCCARYRMSGSLLFF